MAEHPPSRGDDGLCEDPIGLLGGRSPLGEWLYARSHAGRWRLSRERFSAMLERSARKHLAAGKVNAGQVEDYFRALHLEDLALAVACEEGCEAAWDHFFAAYRTYLRGAAAAILRREAGSPEACELADSLFPELYGLAGGKGQGRSLFRYFHGRSSLKTWLRAVLAQRHIDSLRAGRRFEELVEEDSPAGRQKTPLAQHAEPHDPHRERYVAFFTRALQSALESLAPQEKERLRLYYAEEKTLAEIGRMMGEHESSVSRHLERVRGDLRQAVENLLRCGFAAANGAANQPGLSEAEVALCFEYSAEDTPIDLEKLLPRPQSSGSVAGKRTS